MAGAGERIHRGEADGVKRILLTGVGSPASQNFLQCLRMAPEKFYIVGADVNRYHLEWGELDKAYESPWTSDPDYLDWLNRLIETESVDFVHGQPDYEVAFLADHAAELKARTFYPRPDVIQRAQDKFRACDIWADAGLCHQPLRAERFGFPASWDYPVWVRATKGAGARGACKVENAEQGKAWLQHWATRQSEWEFMVEEYLPGTEYAWHSLWFHGELVCSATREYIEKPMSQHMGGSGISSSYIVAKTVADNEVSRVGEAAVRALDDKPHGSYGMDLRRDRDGNVCPTECNAGRFKTTSLFLARAGCNMPWLFVTLGSTARYDSTKPGLLWIRHNDVESVLVVEEHLRAIPLEIGE